MHTLVARPAKREMAHVLAASLSANRRERAVWRASLALLGLQLAGMLVFSAVQYRRYNLTTDFAAYSQAWAAIAHGHFDPYSSVFGMQFWQNDFELLMWPLAVFYWVYPHAVTLLWLQDIAVVGTEIVALAWVRDALRKDRNGTSNGAVVLGMAALLSIITPWSWFTIGFDFHFVPFATLFALLAARNLWAGPGRLLMVWVPLALICCATAGALIIIGIGVAALAGRQHGRACGFAVVLAGLAWLGLGSGISATRFAGIDLGSMYGYLAGGVNRHLTLLGALEGFVTHPNRAADMFRSHAVYVAGWVASGGAIGLASRWGVFPAVFVLLPNALNADPNFIHFAAAFQNWPAVVFLVVGSALTLDRIVSKAASPRRVIAAFGCCTLATAAVIPWFFLRSIPPYLERVNSGAAEKLATAQQRIPRGAEVVASQGVVGRFSTGRAAYPYWAVGVPERYPVSSSKVVFILAPVQGTAEGYPRETYRA
ncbi:MAG TPA: DUF2079 domain-containing protein, partial [Acidimicrobiales bacterium]|nr:DUF2079 domain-containing protein [Acidimicrobiales bacterium]